MGQQVSIANDRVIFRRVNGRIVPMRPSGRRNPIGHDKTKLTNKLRSREKTSQKIAYGAAAATMAPVAGQAAIAVANRFNTRRAGKAFRMGAQAGLDNLVIDMKKAGPSMRQKASSAWAQATGAKKSGLPAHRVTRYTASGMNTARGLGRQVGNFAKYGNMAGRVLRSGSTPLVLAGAGIGAIAGMQYRNAKTRRKQLEAMK